MIHSFKVGKTKLTTYKRNSKLASSPTSLVLHSVSLQSPSTNYPLKNAWHHEFLHNHVFKGLHQTAGNNQSDTKLNFFFPFNFIQEHGIHIKASNLRLAC